MSRIKNWELTVKRKYWRVYKNKISMINLFIDSYLLFPKFSNERRYMFYIVNIEGKKRVFEKDIKTMKKAVKVAINYMKKHPNG